MADELTTRQRVERLLGDEAQTSSSADLEQAVARVRTWLAEYQGLDVGPDFDLASYIARGRAVVGRLVQQLDQ